jgi:broad specificity phosphatase PhoE
MGISIYRENDMSIFLVRHGDKAKGDYFNLILKHQDPPLSDKGIEQSKAVAKYFSQTHISSIYVSSYIRTHQTAQPIADLKQIQPIEDPRLNEVDNGLIDGMNEQEFKKAYPDVWKQYDARTTDFRFPGGETGQDVRSRISEFLEEKLKIHGKENILIFSHDGLIRVCMTYILDIPVYCRSDFKIDLCGLTQFDYQSEISRWKLFRFNHNITLHN